MPGPATPSHSGLKWSSVIDQFQIRLELTSPFIHAFGSLPFFGQIAQAQGEIYPPWQDEMKEDGEAVRCLERCDRGRTLSMVMKCLDGRLPASLLLFILWAPRALHLQLQGHGSLVEEARPSLTGSGSPWWSAAGPITP